MRFCTRTLPLLFFTLMTIGGLSAQNYKSGPVTKKEESHWGYGINIGNLQFFNSIFNFGLSPNVAYKLDDNLAIGFMFKLNYYYEKYPQLQLKFSSFDFGPTIFTRWKPLWKSENVTPFLKGLFAQLEYERAYIARAATDDQGNLILSGNGNRIKAVRDPEDYLYIGVGASGGYPLSTFFSIHYNILDDFSHSRFPWDYRIGITYNY